MGLYRLMISLYQVKNSPFWSRLDNRALTRNRTRATYVNGRAFNGCTTERRLLISSAERQNDPYSPTAPGTDAKVLNGKTTLQPHSP